MDAADNWKPPYLCILRATRMDKRWRGKKYASRRLRVYFTRVIYMREGSCAPRFILWGKLKRHNFPRPHACILFTHGKKKKKNQIVYIYIPRNMIYTWGKYSIHIWGNNNCDNKNIFYTIALILFHSRYTCSFVSILSSPFIHRDIRYSLISLQISRWVSDRYLSIASNVSNSKKSRDRRSISARRYKRGGKRRKDGERG